MNIGNLIEKGFDSYKDIEPYLSSTQKAILNKIFSNLEVVNFCIELDKYNEARIILRSAIESAVLFCYISKYPEKESEYIQDCQLMEFKKHLISYKEYLRNKEIPEFQETIKNIDEQKLISENENFFRILSKENQYKILSIIKEKEYKLTLQTFNKLDKYYNNKFRPIFTKLEKMYKALENFTPDIKFHMRELFFRDYNIYSQLAHGNFISWNLKVNKLDKLQIIRTIKRILLIPYLILKNKGIKVKQDSLKRLSVEIDIIEQSI